MPFSVTTAFLSLCLIFSFQSFAKLENPESGIWLLFFYYVLTKIRYYQGDYQFDKHFHSVIRVGTKANQVLVLHFRVAAHFLFLICATFVNNPELFFRFYVATLLVNIVLLLLTRHLIDTGKPASSKLCDAIRNWIWINVAELIFCFVGAFALQILPDILPNYPSLKILSSNNITMMLVVVLFAIHILDVIWHQDFLFPEKSEP